MSVGYPLGLLALLGVVPLVAAYFLRRRQKPRVVSALFLWRTPERRAQAGPRWQRFSREASLLFELLAVACAALFLGDVHCGKRAEQRHIVVVVDGSLSMQATPATGTPVVERVRDAVAKLIASEHATQVSLLESGLKPVALAGPQETPTVALAALERWRPQQPAHDVMPALAWARELAGGKGQRVTFFTDGPLPDGVTVPPEVTVLSVGQRADNVALASVQRSDEAGQASITVRVTSFSAQPVDVPVMLQPADGDARVERLTLAPLATGLVRARVTTAAEVVVSLPPDALRPDDTATLLPASLKPVTVAVLDGLAGAAVVRRALRVAPGAELVAAGAAALTVGPADSAAQVTIGATGTLRAFVGPFFTQKGHPLLEDVQLDGVMWAAGDNPPGRALVTAGGAVLLAEDDDGRVHLNLDLTRSNVQRTAAWPVLMGNLVRRARNQQPGFARRQLMLGEPLPVSAERGHTFVVVAPDGSKRPLIATGPAQLPEATLPGRWQLWRDGELFDELQVLSLDARESDLRTRGPFERQAAAPQALAATAALAAPRSFWPVVVLLAAVLLAFWLSAKESR